MLCKRLVHHWWVHMFETVAMDIKHETNIIKTGQISSATISVRLTGFDIWNMGCGASALAVTLGGCEGADILSIGSWWLRFALFVGIRTTFSETSSCRLISTLDLSLLGWYEYGAVDACPKARKSVLCLYQIGVGKPRRTTKQNDREKHEKSTRSDWLVVLQWQTSQEE